MQLEKQVVSLDLAKRLKELGVKQDSLYWWDGEELFRSVDRSSKMLGCISAFTVAELLNMLQCTGKESILTPINLESETTADWLARYLINEKSKV